METIPINIVNIVGDSFCTTEEDGQKVFELIKKALSRKEKVALSFLDVEMLSIAFLNAAVAKLYEEFNEDFINEYVSVENISKAGEISLKRVVNTFKIYIRDPEAMKIRIKEILEE